MTRCPYCTRRHARWLHIWRQVRGPLAATAAALVVAVWLYAAGCDLPGTCV